MLGADEGKLLGLLAVVLVGSLVSSKDGVVDGAEVGVAVEGLAFGFAVLVG